jgi:glucan phosphoethanolaminetransferase (alkaline phosphatase superfamily)
MSPQMWMMILIFLLLLSILLVVIMRGKQTVYLKPKNNNGNDSSENSSISNPIQFGATQANQNDDVKKTELQSLRQKAVSMSVSEKAGANQIVQDWLGDTESEESGDNEETQKEEE